VGTTIHVIVTISKPYPNFLTICNYSTTKGAVFELRDRSAAFRAGEWEARYGDEWEFYRRRKK
jgi:hypothetical protein